MENMDFNLWEFPDEILERIFSHLNDMDLLDYSRVCTRFEQIAKDAFRLKYNGSSIGRHYKIYIADSYFDPLFVETFKTFGKHLKALHVCFDSSSQTEWKYVCGMIETFCPSITHLMCSYETFCPSITHLMCSYERRPRYDHVNEMMNLVPGLTHLTILSGMHVEESEFRQFFQNNPKLEHLNLKDCYGLEVIGQVQDKLSGLKSLTLRGNKNMMDGSFVLPSLKSLKISLKIEQAENAIRTFSKGCKNIERLVIEGMLGQVRVSPDEENGILCELINQIASFDNLMILSIDEFNFSPDLMRALVQRLPKLKFLQFNSYSGKTYSVTSNDILFIFTECMHLGKLVIADFGDSEPYFDLNFHHEFTELARSRANNIVFIYNNEENEIIVTNEKIQRNRKWMGYDVVPEL